MNFSRKAGLLLGLLLFVPPLFGAGEPTLTLRRVGLDQPSSFPQLLWIHIKNEAYVPLGLGDLVASSKLLIDGIPFQRLQTPFDGPPGLPAQGEWEGCFLLSDYTTSLIEGRHEVRFMLGGSQSGSVSLHWNAFADWHKGDMKSRLKEVHNAASEIPEGLPRSCVERWFTVRDGGPQENHAIRYYLEPQIKVVVPYAPLGPQSEETEKVHGPLRVYTEPLLSDVGD